MYEGDLHKHIPAPVVETEAQRNIRLARALLSNPERWFKGEYCSATRDACCIYGALNVAMNKLPGDQGPSPGDRFVEEAVAERDGNPVVVFNDHPDTTHADVLAVLDRAYELAGANSTPHAAGQQETPA